MRIPQSAERFKEAPGQVLRAVLSKDAPAQQALRGVLSKDAPAQALRAVFSSVGQVLLVTEKVRRRAMGGDQENAAPAAVSTSKASPGTPKPSTAKASTPKASTPKASAAKASTARTSTTKASTAKTSAAKVSPAKTSTPKTASSTPEPAGTPPIPHYSELSMASLRARMRGLDVGQLSELVSYERAHEDRETVIGMFERRIAKLQQEGPAAAS